LAGVPGLLGPEFLLHPMGLAVEVEHLERLGVADPWGMLEVDLRARVITPYQQGAGRIREMLRGDEAHGTCGVGVGECVADSIAAPDEVLRAGDLGDATVVRARLGRQRDRKRAEIDALGGDLGLFDDAGLIDRAVDAWGDVARRLRVVSGEQAFARVAGADRVVFEGAQGVLIDEAWGFHPHTTWSDCTPRNALALAGDREVVRLGVTRAYGVRHGPGPFPTEDGEVHAEPHNADDGWQGRFRAGALDGVLLRYAVGVCGGIDALAVTCVDRAPAGPVCDGYRAPAPPDLAIARGDRVVSLVSGAYDDLTHRERLGRWLRTVEPILEAGDPVRFCERATGVRVRLLSEGPRSQDKRWR